MGGGAPLAAASYQRATGPTYPMRGTVTLDGAELEYELVRSGNTTDDAWVEIPDPGSDARATLAYRRYPTADPLSRVPFQLRDGVLAAPLPRQQAAGKLEYHVELAGDGEVVRIPASPENDPIIRFKDPVPLAALLPHVLFMFFAILVATAVMLAVYLVPHSMRGSELDYDRLEEGVETHEAIRTG